MDQWLDSLSEDWVSQPRSPHSSPPVLCQISRDSLSPSSNNGSQSRIPRYKPRTASGISVTNEKDSMRRSSNPNALREKTPSNINASQKRVPHGQAKPQSLNAASMRLRGRLVSTGSIPNEVQDTVQYRASPVKDIGVTSTPDWKRRVLEENVGSGDLFSPIGLEGMFRPPTVGAKGKKAKGAGKKKMFASSPPPYTAPQDSENAAGLPLPQGKPEEERMKDNLRPASRRFLSQDAQIMNMTAQKHAANGEAQGPSLEVPLSPGLPRCGRPSSVNQQQDSQELRDDAQHSDTGGKTRNEQISPLYISRQHTVGGHIEFGAIDLSVRRLQSEMAKLRMQQHNIPSSRSSDHGFEYTDSGLGEQSLLYNRVGEVTSQSLPDDLSMGTEAFAANGGFVTAHRGGYSNDGSFQRRPVSPSLLPDLDGPSLRMPSSTEDERKDSQETFENFAQTKSKTPSSPPETPHKHHDEDCGSDERPRSSGSPLKLFDKYDTFTNDRLVRRLSKFEATLNQGMQEDHEIRSDGLLSTPSPGPKLTRRRSQRENSEDRHTGRRISSFGDGDLDSHQFVTHGALAHARKADRSDSAQQNENSSNLVKVQHADPHDSSDNQLRWSNKTNSRGRHASNEDTLTMARNFRPRNSAEYIDYKDKHQYSPQQEPLKSTGKRLPYSPDKDPAPKRRRTLRSAEVADLEIASFLPQTKAEEEPAQRLLGRKRKDALYDGEHQAADPRILASREMLHPKAPTPRRRNHVGRNRNDEESTPTHEKLYPGHEFPRDLSQEEQPSQILIDPPTQIVAGALATVALNTAQEITGGSRKPSVTTADFFNEAQLIMQMIRAKGRPRSSHTTAETSEVGPPTILEESLIEDSTKDQFSRPPSRQEDNPARVGLPRRIDSRIVSHLRKFEDKEDLGFALSCSLKDLQVSQSGKLPESDLKRGQDRDHQRTGIESDPPNIRLRQSLVPHHEHKHSASTEIVTNSETQTQSSSHGTNFSSAHSTNHSNPTESSHSSTNRMVIAPETVAHLLSDQMAGMAYDHQKNVWVKRKSTPNIGGMDNIDHNASEGTEEDFFGDIPDLSVNEMEELQRVKDAVSSLKSQGSTKDRISVHDLAIAAEREVGKYDNQEPIVDTRPKRADGKSIDPVDNSSAPSKNSHFAFSGPLPGTRATSWGDEVAPPNEPQLLEMPRLYAFKSVQNTSEQEVEHEYSILDGRQSPTLKARNKGRQARVVTVAFSSPLVEQRASEDGSQDVGEEDGPWDSIDSPSRSACQSKAFAARRTSSSLVNRSGIRMSSCRQSIGNKSYITRPMSRLDEHEEMSLVNCSIGNRRMSMEIAISTPIPKSRSLVLPLTSSQKSSVDFFLSPLPDFTINQVDRPLERETVARHDCFSKSRTYNQLSLAAQDLVKNLTDVEPFEPYWEDIRSVDLRDRRLQTMHMLDEFCGRVEELDVSNNQIRELNGIPRSVRFLNIRGNCLSDLAAWHSLQNLQYLDVSGNQLNTLKGFSYLFHLRGLKADNNEMESLEGIEDLDGLTSLSMQGNKLRRIDFGSYNLNRLIHMNLSRNDLTEVFYLHRLTSLESCDLSHNGLEALDFCISEPLVRLQTLDVSDNNLTFLDLAEVPNLKSLNIDTNSVGSIESLSRLKHLESLSWREQSLDPAYGVSEIQYQHCHEIRKLYLSGNNLSTFAPTNSFLNLHYLELASTGIKTLSPNFGTQCPNLRTLNINYNAIQDLRPLLGIVKLRRLYAAGNRISKLRRTVSVLQRLSIELTEVDLRNNPLAVGYYTPQEPSKDEKSVTIHHHKHVPDHDGDPQLKAEQANLLPFADWEADNHSRERLDEDTKIRRRVYEMMIVIACKKLNRLDGLEISRQLIGRHDGVWERLVELGVLTDKGAMQNESCDQ